MPYEKSTNSGETTFSVNPEKAPSLLKTLLLPLSIPFLILCAVDILLGLMAAGVLGAWIYFSQNSKNVTQYRTSSKFSVSPTGVKINGVFYAMDDIHRLIIRNHVDEQYVFISNYQSYHAPASTARGLQLRRKLIDVSYRIDLESNGKAIPLAGGLNEPTAYAVLSDVNKMLKFNGS